MPLASLFSASTCQVAPENVGVLTLFGTALAIGVALSILTGKTYYRRVIAKDEEPFNYWFSVDCLLACPGDLCSGHASGLFPPLSRLDGLPWATAARPNPGVGAGLRLLGAVPGKTTSRSAIPIGFGCLLEPHHSRVL